MSVREECVVFGVMSPELCDVASLCYYCTIDL